MMFEKTKNKQRLTWSMACMEKLNVINSQTGLNPLKAAPTANPANPISVIGVSMTRLLPYFFHSPRETWKFAVLLALLCEITLEGTS